MARAVTAEWQRVAPAAMPAAMARWRVRRDRVTAAGAHYWVFRSTADPDSYVEFIEARDAATLASARSDAEMAAPDDLLTEVELS